ncbi:hypothetical protein JTE90_012203 [Oedothorax gibbosus]|uniref:Spondin domain-containing protein n=1 Tax=Oedothorax gibbosus TaxID=931172 RepID=A0AAV6TTR6_9ARAC|nr:hypothetical protein JTE90_012203 [Oedothorax gibbosus]
MSFMVWLVFVGSCTAVYSSQCPSDVLVMYRMVVHMEWAEETFPKQYPLWRPPAQWSVVVGRSHNASGVLWRLGKTASDSLKVFIETGKSDLLIREGKQQKRGVLSEFFAPPVQKGVGVTEAVFFADALHSKVSAISRITPSPDWFVGVDSFDLCIGNKWLDTVSLDLEPTDGGTDNGYTFSSPKWATEPRSPISHIRSRFPDHPANSFFYPEMENLPRIAYVRFLKLKEFSLSKQMSPEVLGENLLESSVVGVPGPSLFSPDNELDEFDKSLKQEKKKQKRKKSIMDPAEMNAFRSRPEITMKSKSKNPKKHHYRRKPCRVGEWSEWGNCSKICEFGEQIRTREVIHYASKNGRPCPPLEETRRCRDIEMCRNPTTGFFRWQ